MAKRKTPIHSRVKAIGKQSGFQNRNTRNDRPRLSLYVTQYEG